MSYQHITINERSCIFQLLISGLSIRKIAKALQRSPSTISREIQRNTIETRNKYNSFKRYFPVKAQELYNSRREKCRKQSKINNQIITNIQEKLLNQWSPDQIYNRSKLEDIPCPSTATIYRLIRKQILPKVRIEHLRRKGKFKRPAETRGKFNDGGRSIKNVIKLSIKEKKSVIGKVTL